LTARIDAARLRDRSVYRIQPRVRDDRDTPLWWSGRRQTAVADKQKEAEYFQLWDWTLCRALRLLAKLEFARTLFLSVLSAFARFVEAEIAQTACQVFCPSGKPRGSLR